MVSHVVIVALFLFSILETKIFNRNAKIAANFKLKFLTFLFTFLIKFDSYQSLPVDLCVVYLVKSGHKPHKRLGHLCQKTPEHSENSIEQKNFLNN